MSTKNAKRARFAHRMRQKRVTDRIFKRYSGTAGFVGAVTKFRINGMSLGPGALFAKESNHE